MLDVVGNVCLVCLVVVAVCATVWLCGGMIYGIVNTIIDWRDGKKDNNDNNEDKNA